jgi:hypothetical protein
LGIVHGIRNTQIPDAFAGSEIARGQDRTSSGLRHGAQAGSRLLGKARENHRDVIAGMLVAGAGNHDAVAIDAAIVGGRLQREGHFRPRRERSGTAEFDAAFVDDDRAGGENQSSLAGFDGDVLLEGTRFNFSRAHTS